MQPRRRIKGQSRLGTKNYRVVVGAWSTRERAAFAKDALSLEIAQHVRTSSEVHCVRDLQLSAYRPIAAAHGGVLTTLLDFMSIRSLPQLRHRRSQ